MSTLLRDTSAKPALRAKREPGIVGYLRRAMRERAGDRRELRTLMAAEHVESVVKLFAITSPAERAALRNWLDTTKG